MKSDTAILCCFFDSNGLKIRKKNFDNYVEYLRKCGVLEHLFVCEVLFRGQKPSIQLPNTLHVYADSILWHKEAALNLLLKKLPAKYTKVVWTDTDISWGRDLDWLKRISIALNTHLAVQPFTLVNYLNQSLEIEGNINGNIYAFLNHLPNGNPGIAMAYRRSFLEAMGGLYDKVVIGGGDQFNCLALKPVVTMGFLDRLFPDLSPDFLDYWLRSNRLLQKKYHYIDGLACYHFWHGEMKERRYESRVKISAKYNFFENFERAPNGLWITKNKKVEADFSKYFRSRKC